MEKVMLVAARKEIADVTPYVAGKPIEEVQRELKLDRVIKLASNENPYGCSRLATEAVERELSQISLYPEASGPMLLQKLANRFGLESGNVILGAGSDELIRLLTRAFNSTGDEAIMADVTFPRYETNVTIEGGVPVTIPLIEGVHNLEGMLAAVTEKTKIMFVCNPNNPTGTIVGKAALLAFIENVPKHIMIVVDEAYCEYVEDSEYLDTVPLLSEFPNLVILRTFSKIYGLAALRVGYALAHPTIVRNLHKVRDSFNTSRLSQAAALAALDDEDFVTTCRQKNKTERAYLQNELDAAGLRYFPSHGNFIMVHFPDHTGDDIFQRLLRQGIIVRPGNLLGYPQTVRVTIGDSEQNQAFIAALRNILNGNDQQ
ncbi:histidinol-phosphate transaminase [Paenibacillus sp. MZ04-78.2]|uniref:histidinol-phosphate transaminase n=1 Tax=Paenibacillus sp. MZ04-78.2 TaxID=2962034 RepID=UPI0020B8380A|nr:histidinol-phosphate transaminase [Paenibacillus sp. MZ04-78.2]MCP3772763.1 histidinol-phosphate transaminase [Paenibacillus sp. MZ04-78.2]